MAHWSDESANDYLYFVQALEVLSTEAAEQCERMGDYNVAWELKDDVMAGRHLLDSSLFDETQTQLFGALAVALDAVPPEALRSGSGREVSLVSMSNAGWDRPRQLARELLARLESLSRENRIFLQFAGTRSNPSFERTATRPLN